MTPDPETSYIDDVKVSLQDDITVDWDVYTMATFDATIVKPEALNGFDAISIMRDEIEIFGGRVETYSPVFSSRGRHMRITGFDNTVRLRDYKTPTQTITDESTEDALTAIISETPFDVELTGDFDYVTELKSWDTFVELATELEINTNIALELDLTKTPEIDSVIDLATYVVCLSSLNNIFRYDGATPRFYQWFVDDSDDLYYMHSVDGETWTVVDSTANINAVSSNHTVTWDGSNIYLIFRAVDGDIDCWDGSINDGNGTITWDNQYDGVIAANSLLAGPQFDSQGHIWILCTSNNGEAYESTDTGATWNSRFSATVDCGANHDLENLADYNNDGDIMGIVFDDVANDTEEWIWDRSAGTFAFVQKIDDEVDVLGSDVCQDGDYNVYFAFRSTTTALHYAYYDFDAGTWSVVDLPTAGDMGGVSSYPAIVCSDGYSAYLKVGVFINPTAYYRIYKAVGTTLDTEYYESEVFDDFHETSTLRFPGGYLMDGNYAMWFSYVDVNSDAATLMFSPLGVRIVMGEIAGTIRTVSVTASGAFTRWGLCSAVGNADLGETTWNILRAATNAELIDDQPPNFDMDAVGVPDTDLSIKVYIELVKVAGDPIIYVFSVTERSDFVSLDTDGEDCYTGVSKLATLVGGEYWVTDDGDGTYTVHFSTRRGEDKSGWIILKCSTTTDEPDTKANVKVLSTTYDYNDFANAVLFIGGLDEDGDRVEAEVQDQISIDARGQPYWVTVRDAEVTTLAMAQTRASLELTKRNSVALRIRGEFVDKNASNAISIGDSVTLIGEWNDADLKISGDYRIVTLSRTWGVGGGERVVAEFSNRLKPAQYYNYLQKVDSLERVSTS